MIEAKDCTVESQVPDEWRCSFGFSNVGQLGAWDASLEELALCIKQRCFAVADDSQDSDWFDLGDWFQRE